MCSCRILSANVFLSGHYTQFTLPVNVLDFSLVFKYNIFENFVKCIFPLNKHFRLILGDFFLSNRIMEVNVGNFRLYFRMSEFLAGI